MGARAWQDCLNDNHQRKEHDMPNNQRLTSRTVHEVHVTIEDDIITKISPEDQVEIHLHSNAMNREPAPIRLSYATLLRLTRDK